MKAGHIGRTYDAVHELVAAGFLQFEMVPGSVRVVIRVESRRPIDPHLLALAEGDEALASARVYRRVVDAHAAGDPYVTHSQIEGREPVAELLPWAAPLDDGEPVTDGAVTIVGDDGMIDIGRPAGAHQSTADRLLQMAREPVVASVLDEMRELIKRAGAPARLFAVGDRVRTVRRVRSAWLDQDLADEGEDPWQYVDVPAGTLGTVFKVRGYPTPFPYLVHFQDDRETGVAEYDLERIARELDRPAAVDELGGANDIG